MTIEFNCPICWQPQTGEEKDVGRKIRCSGCGNRIEIPAATGDGSEPANVPSTGDGSATGYENLSAGDGSESTDGLAADPMATAGVGSLDVGDVCSTSWAIYKDQMGLVLGGVVIALFIQQMAGAPASIVNQIMQLGDVDDQTAMILVVVVGVLQVLSGLVQIYMMCGTTRLLLNVVKGQPAEISDIFRGGPYFGRMLICSIVFGLMACLGLVFCIIPGIIIGLMFMPFGNVLVDRDTKGLDALWQARDLTSGHKVTLFVLSILMMGIQFLGLMACCVGVFFTTPLVTLMGTVAYMRLSGQKTIVG